MPTGDANRAVLRYFKEVSYGTVTGNPKFTNIRYTSETLGQDNSFIRPETIRDDRQSDDIIRTDIAASGDLNFEYAPKEYDFLEEAVMNVNATWSTEINQVLTATFATITFGHSAGANTITRSGGTSDWVADLSAGNAAGLVGMWLESYGWNNAVNNTIFKICAGSTTTVLNVNSVTVMTTESSASSASKNFRKLGMITGPGVAAVTSYAFEKHYADVGSVFDRIFGCVPDVYKISMAVGAVITGSCSFLGSSGVHATATMGDGSPTAAQTTRFLNTIDHVVGIMFGQTGFPISFGADPVKFDFQIKANARTRKKFGSAGAESIGIGELEASGSGEFLFASNPNYYIKGYDFTDTGVAAITKEPTSGNIKVWDFPKIKVTKVRRSITGKNKDVLISLEFQAFRDSTEGVTVRMARRSV